MTQALLLLITAGPVGYPASTPLNPPTPYLPYHKLQALQLDIPRRVWRLHETVEWRVTRSPPRH